MLVNSRRDVFIATIWLMLSCRIRLECGVDMDGE